MGDGELLLGAILAEPADDTARLVYADWLEENAGTLACPTCPPCTKDPRVAPGRVPVIDPNGHGPGHPKAWWEDCKRCDGSGRVPDGLAARAEFIRVQCESARLSASQTCRECCPVSSRIARKCRGCDLRRREGELLEWGGYGWCDGLLGPDWKTDGVGKAGPDVTVSYHRGAEHTGHMRLSFRRGFVESLTLSAADWLAHERALYWRPGLSDPCPKCGGAGGTICPRCRKGGDSLNCNLSAGDPCPACSGKGTVPRPMPPTAQPITRVTLPNLSIHPGNMPIGCPITFHGYPVVMTGENSFTCDRWPGITFDLSTAAPG